jgi:hypothetical protein
VLTVVKTARRGDNDCYTCGHCALKCARTVSHVAPCMENVPALCRDSHVALKMCSHVVACGTEMCSHGVAPLHWHISRCVKIQCTQSRGVVPNLRVVVHKPGNILCTGTERTNTHQRIGREEFLIEPR